VGLSPSRDLVEVAGVVLVVAADVERAERGTPGEEPGAGRGAGVAGRPCGPLDGRYGRRCVVQAGLEGGPRAGCGVGLGPEHPVGADLGSHHDVFAVVDRVDEAHRRRSAGQPVGAPVLEHGVAEIAVDLYPGHEPAGEAQAGGDGVVVDLVLAGGGGVERHQSVLGQGRHPPMLPPPWVSRAVPAAG
jgi:hypothetical protein